MNLSYLERLISAVAHGGYILYTKNKFIHGILDQNKNKNSSKVSGLNYQSTSFLRYEA
jgi:hypothetical protein